MKLKNCKVTEGLPLKIEFDNVSIAAFGQWYKDYESVLESALLEWGGILIRGLDITELAHFQDTLKFISKESISYVDGFSPRTKLSAGVYTSTEYDKDFSITLHNELSYSAKWPSKIFFCCLVPATEGGETPIVDCRRVLKKIPADLVEKMQRVGVKYVRNLHSGSGFGPSWQQTYETTDQSQMEKFCADNDIRFSWRNDGYLHLEQRRNAIIEHPVTLQKVWFNQVDQFHPSHMDEEIYETLMLLHEHKEELLPMFGCFGDGSKISMEQVKEIREVVDGEAVRFSWEQGDLLILDNILVAHGRMPYKGERKVVVSMC